MNNNSTIVSVLMTAYCRERYIGEAIESVLASTYTNFELIITDDQSKDNTVAIARSYAEKDARVKVYVNEQNLGDYPNRNKAASHATGKYLKYVDADDYIYPWGLQLLVQMMEQFPEAGWGLCSLEQDVTKPFPFLLSPAEAYQYHYKNAGLFHKAPLSSIIRKDVFDKIGGFSLLRMAGDFEMWHRLAQNYPVLLMPQGMVWYREHSEQEMNSYHRFLPSYEEIKRTYLTSTSCPLEKRVVKNVISGIRNDLRKEIVKGILTLNLNRIKNSLLKLRTWRSVGIN